LPSVIAAGQRVFGENRVQEAKAKWPALRERYPGPWKIDETIGSSFAVRCGQRVMACVYYRTQAEGRTDSSLTRAEALAMARAIVALAKR